MSLLHISQQQYVLKMTFFSYFYNKFLKLCPCGEALNFRLVLPSIFRLNSLLSSAFPKKFKIVVFRLFRTKIIIFCDSF